MTRDQVIRGDHNPKKVMVEIQRDTLINRGGRTIYELCVDWNISYMTVNRYIKRFLEDHPEYREDPTFVLDAPNQFNSSEQETYLHPEVFKAVYTQINEEQDKEREIETRQKEKQQQREESKVEKAQMLERGEKLKNIGGKTIFEIANLLNISVSLVRTELNDIFSDTAIPESDEPLVGKILKSEGNDTHTYVYVYHPDVVQAVIDRRTNRREKHKKLQEPTTPLEYKRAILEFFEGEDQETVEALLNLYRKDDVYHPNGDTSVSITLESIYKNLQAAQERKAENNAGKRDRSNVAEPPLDFLYFLNETRSTNTKVDMTRYETAPTFETEEEKRLQYLPEILSFFPNTQQHHIKKLLVEDGCLQGDSIFPKHTRQISDTLTPDTGVTVTTFIHELEKKLTDDIENRHDPELYTDSNGPTHLSPQPIIAWLEGRLVEAPMYPTYESSLAREILTAPDTSDNETDMLSERETQGIQISQPFYDVVERLGHTLTMKKVIKASHSADVSAREVAERLDMLLDYFDLTAEQLQTMLYYYPNTIMRSKKELVEELKERAEFWGISRRKLKKKIPKNPFFIGATIEHLTLRQQELVSLFEEYGIRTNESIIHQKAQAHPHILVYRPETVKEKISYVASVFNITVQKAATMLFQSPEIITMKPERLEKAITAIMYVHEIERTAALQKAIETPSLLSHCLYSEKFRNRNEN